LRALLAAGARAAEPGEFTLRAFLHGRLDLTEAEAVLQVVSAQSADGLQRALEDLQGDMARRIAPARAAVISALAYLDASADFPDDEIPVSDVSADLAAADEALADVLRGVTSGRLMTEGATVALIGKPNVGKSSLLNALLRSDRAIVTPIAGTTRDVVSETAVIDGIPVQLLDTAGLTETDDVVERAGIARSEAALERAIGLIVVIDGSQPLTAEDRDVLARVRSRFASGAAGPAPVVVACNKGDAGQLVSPDEVVELLGIPVAAVSISATHGDGVPELERVIGEALRAGTDPGARPSLLTARQHAELDRALLHIRTARQALADGFPTDLLATDVRLAARSLGRVTGEDVDDAVLNEIFSRFCIGK
jgi:tRNA modification GTPase